ncbi:hypothetical protein COX67_04970 [Candidatus Falkowbacteria bacterium CG_4_10_14_0_2_um_filter_36_22]|uniref:Cell envelope-related transcriptional attenuator domain-containing protein n=2 Tax=Candidatus Falkowiibacteriota TaxID=1752728 RepID=A0A1J4T3P6_9BACT|nr:MAG: hypothetical protein AUJ27_04230 [Candidatus Falkowbacteria bacterium CG1_02_37_44]PIV51897.1 MAG: hypothetical protein COS18_01585 [Candidatus Falkowbacteria bacterium CG02_land_8_20_14_3_00_36_14]PJA10279.1 MAG: hypothetical protein COX67_04970 [Candidatus Falkowbacteria bacterium CG_4_10_14_0_2_um_filter_36_22]
MFNNKNLKIDLKEQAENTADVKNTIKPNKIKKIIKIFFYSFIFVFIIFIFFGLKIIIPGQESTSWILRLPIISQLKHLVDSADNKLKGEEMDSINILLLGMGGINHEGGNLTDTIILVSLKPSSKKISMLSIPRDLAVPVENVGWRKINNINAFAEATVSGSGGLAVSQTISDTLNMPIDYFVRVDFAGFEKIIDDLGGIKVYVDNTLDDYSYPLDGKEDDPVYENRYEYLHIAQGWHNMDGAAALKYARSRHAKGGEGSDFARARRQQKIIEATKDKIFSLKILLKPKMISSIIDNLEKHLSTNFNIWEMVKIWDLFNGVKSDDIINRVLDNSPNGLLTDMIAEDGAYILTPRSGDFTEIQYLVNNLFADAPPEYKSEVTQEETTVEVRNGTWINGLASKIALDLEKYGFNIARIGNSKNQNFQKSVIYDLTYGAKMKSLTVLKNKMNADVYLGMPEWLIEDLSAELAKEKNPVQPDFILVIGQDADVTESGTENIIK